jgi:type III pantothenate kinase
MLFVADVGNTETTIGLFEGEALLAQWRLTTDVPRTPDELALVLQELLATKGVARGALHGCAIGSVVPGFTATLHDACVAVSGARVRVIDSSSVLPIRLDVEEPASVGADRILNTLAASHLFKRDCIVVDLGTATTFDCITADGVFLGGVISPGLQTSADTLFRRTAKLSATELVPPQSVIGRRTDEAIRSGVVLGAVEQIEGLVRRIKAAWPRPTNPYVIGTGGLAATIAPLCPSVETVIPELTLVGLRLAWDWLEKPIID